MDTPAINSQKTGLLKQQFIPLFLTVMVFLGLSGLFYLCINALNLIPSPAKISLKVRWYDVLIGGAIYLKTAVDFAIFMGRLMASNPGWKNRVAIELGTALGNGLGTIIILIIWTFFKEIDWLLALMIFLASMVLFELAYASLEHFANWEKTGRAKHVLYQIMNKSLSVAVKLTEPITRKILPDLGEKLKGSQHLPWKKLLVFALSVPFILGLDDFAGYVPLFNVVRIFGFSIGVIGAHMILNIALFINPEATVRAVRNEWISFLGALAFICLGIWGIIEVIKIFIH
ncbi:MAG: hypothetical protein HYZ51_01400 [Candidatus Doudnabacteria bacterium]|nr:hypothetical protein [Candidatus Doudnabacteria bacterium]